MQGTVATFDPATRAGSVLTDEGRPVGFAEAALASHIRHLRVGQRVFFELDPQERDEAAAISIFPPER